MVADDASTSTSWRVATVVLALAFVALTAAIVVAHRAPASGYETSIYTATPIGFWAGVAVALLAALAVGLLPDAGGRRTVALFLGGTAIVTIAALPIIRGYYFFADPDSLTHLGWTREIVSGVRNPFELFYPGIHTLAIFLSELTGMTLPRSLMLMVVAFVALYLVVVTLTLRLLLSDGLALTVGAASAFMLLPINIIVTQLAAHPISQASLFLPLVLFLLVKYLLGSEATADAGRSRATGIGALLALSTAALLVYHPQEAVVALVLFGTIAGVQFLYRRRGGLDRLSRSRPLYAQTIFLAALFLVWTVAHQNLSAQISLIVTTVAGFFAGQSGPAGAVVGDRAVALQAIGSGLLEIFLKLFLVSAIYAAIAGVIMASSFLGRFGREFPDTGTAIKSFAFGFIVLLPFASLHFVGHLSKLFFRYVASMMVIMTILGAVGLVYFVATRRARVTAVGRTALGVALAAMLALSILTFFPSPYLYQPSMHVTEQQVAGYETTFEITDGSAALSGVRMPVWRYQQALQGPADVARDSNPDIPPEFDHALADFLVAERGPAGHYLVVTEFDRTREVEVYRGLRFDAADFRQLDRNREVNLVQSNGEVKLYFTSGTGA